MQLNAREAAFRLLSETEKKGLPTGNCVERLHSDFGLDSKDASLAVNIYLGCIQFRYKLDFCISSCSDIPFEKMDGNVRNILRMAVYQLLYLERIPAHAAVDEAVKLCRNHCPRAVSFVNAMLRRISSDNYIMPEPSGDMAEKLATECSVQKWFAEYLIDRFGHNIAEDYLKESNKQAPLSLKINTVKITVNEYKEILAENSITFNESMWQGIVYVDSCDVKQLPGYKEGFFYVQDPAAAACAGISGATPGMRVLDACSSPGGKAFSTAIMMQDIGTVISCDISEKKVLKIKEGAERLGLNIIQCAVQDAKKYCAGFESSFDLVLADVPCSGFGVLRKKPEIKYKSRNEIAALPEIQKSILDNICRYVKPGGILLYTTCTVLREENEQVVERFLYEHDDFRTIDFEYENIRSMNGMYTFLPNVNGTDGFFAAKLARS